MQKNTHADRVVDFISKFCSSLSVRTTDPAADKTVVEKVHETRNKKSQDDTHNSTLEMDTTLDAENTFLTTLIDFLIKVSLSLTLTLFKMYLILNLFLYLSQTKQIAMRLDTEHVRYYLKLWHL